ncbi:amphi-Trp domain-containing protein [Pimelobacter simplex]|uniref:amphi-Trp domain-containing protein n=1 Tax=Nocardioides simplex TaxID=2045 RepID=UPI0021506A5B|nr:amphi-Trp domain-containing protein [Pimelobacter simplex]UUW91511.1 amphi-Trp domain-containing protein [Pimelobacter simplex]UUW95339.1 amphi-Trp domain-containing protein [Pimelobacter simplex]
MDLFETDHAERISREAAADRLRAIADALSRHNSLEIDKNGRRITVSVPDEVELKVEIEVGDENELEIEISW